MDKLREMRLALGLTQQQVADALNVTRTSVVFWEQGKAMPHVKHIKALATVLKCKVSDLLP